MLLRANGNLFTCKVYCFHMLYILLLCIQELSSFENTPLLVSLRLYRLFLLHALPLAACPWGYLGLGCICWPWVRSRLAALAMAACMPWPWQCAHGDVPWPWLLHALALAACLMELPWPWQHAHGGWLTFKMCWKVTIGHRFDNKFWMVKILRRGLNALESTHSKLEFEHKFCIFTMEMKRVIVVWICPSELLEMWITIMCREESTYLWMSRVKHSPLFQIQKSSSPGRAHR